MNNFFIYLLSLLLGMTEGGIYGPVNHDMPMLQQKNDIRLDFDLNCVGATASAAYAFSNHWGVQGSFQGMDFPIRARYGGQLSAGWFTPLNTNNIFEVYAGASIGHGKRGQVNDEYEALYQSYFVQADYGWCGLANSHIDVALGVKGGYLYGNVEHSVVLNNPETDESMFVEYPYTHSAPFIEPTVLFRFGWEHLKFNLNASMTFSRNNKGASITNPEPRVGVGLNYYFNTKDHRNE
ncbi:MAG: hypothetical protein MJZ77_04840 [Bacteroidales bacterium]|nr:hypothetical protein [Bacteroidales bacterium]MCQ2296968.1 hypothetical protein [Bacteroidales bacterium]